MASATQGIDHIGIVVPDLRAAVDFYVDVFGLTVISREAPTDVDSVAIGLAGEAVRLTGAILQASNGTKIELHQYLTGGDDRSRRVWDRGIGHIGFAVDDIHEAHARLSEQGIRFNTEPQQITGGDLDGRWWVYGQDPWGVVIELCKDPDKKGHDK